MITINAAAAAATATETEMNDRGEDSAVESLLLLNSTTFHQGEKVLAYYRGGIHEAKVQQIDCRTKLFYVHGLNQKWDEWVGKERLMKYNKENLQKMKALKKRHPMENSTKNGLHLKSLNVTRGKKRKTMSKVNEFATSVVGSPPTEAGERATTLHVDHSVTVTPGVGDQGPSGGSMLLPLRHGPELLEPLVSNANVGPVGGPVASGLGPSERFIPCWGLTNDANLLEPDKALDFVTHAIPPGTKARLSALPQTELLKAFRCMAVENLLLMAEAAKRLETFEAKEIELKEELTRCKATTVKDIAIAAEVAVGLRNELKEVQAERADVIKEASRADAARAQVEAESSVLRAGRLELLGRVSEAEGAKMRAEDEAAALKAEIDVLLKKLAQAEAAKKNEDEAAALKAENDELLKKLAQAEAAKNEDEAAALKAENDELLKKLAQAEAAKKNEDEAAALKAENDELLKKLAEAEAAKKYADERLVVAAETEKWSTQELKLTRDSLQNSKKEAPKAAEGVSRLRQQQGDWLSLYNEYFEAKKGTKTFEEWGVEKYIWEVKEA